MCFSLKTFVQNFAQQHIHIFYVALFLLIILFNQQYLEMVHWHEVWLFLTFRQDFPITYQKIDGPFWTLAVEFQFYLLLPLIAWGMGRSSGVAKPAGVCAN